MEGAHVMSKIASAKINNLPSQVSVSTNDQVLEIAVSELQAIFGSCIDLLNDIRDITKTVRHRRKRTPKRRSCRSIRESGYVLPQITVAADEFTIRDNLCQNDSNKRNDCRQGVSRALTEENSACRENKHG